MTKILLDMKKCQSENNGYTDIYNQKFQRNLNISVAYELAKVLGIWNVSIIYREVDTIPDASDFSRLFVRASRFLCISYASIYSSIKSSHSVKNGRRIPSIFPLRMINEGIFSFAIFAEFLWKSIVVYKL